MHRRVPPEEEKFLQHNKSDGSKRPEFTDVSMREAEALLRIQYIIHEQ